MSSSTFLVRNAATRQLVGLFCARRSNDLFCLLDERTDPFGCEYLELKPGEGLFLGDVMAEATEPLAVRRHSAAWRSLELAGFASPARLTASAGHPWRAAASQATSHAV